MPILPIIIQNEKCTLEIVQLLLKYGANVNYSTRLPFYYPKQFLPKSPLRIAVSKNRQFDIVKSLLRAEAKTGATRKVDSTSVLAIALKEVHLNPSEPALNIFKLLLKYAFLENGDVEDDIRRLIMKEFADDIEKDKTDQFEDYVNELKRYANECAREIAVIKSKNINGKTKLYYFIKNNSSPEAASSSINRNLSNKELENMINIIESNNVFLYFDLMADIKLESP